MHEHWKLVEDKAYPPIKGVWEKRNTLPVTWQDGFENPSGIAPLELPLVGGGYIRLGLDGTEDPDIDLDIYAPNSRGEMTESGTIIGSTLAREEYGFWIFFDNSEEPRQAECMKFLARLKPEKDIDWEKIKPDTDEYKIAKALCKYKEFETKFENR